MLKTALLLILASAALGAPATVKSPDAIAMRDAITSVLKGRVVVTPSKDNPVITMEPFDLSTDALLALGHDKHVLNEALSELDGLRNDISSANGITGRPDDPRENVLKANAAWADALKKHAAVSVDLEPIPLEGLALSKNKIDNDAVFGVLGPILKR